MKVKSRTQIAKNYKGAAATAAARYKDAIPTAEMKEAAIAGQDLYVARMADPDVLARRVKGLEKISDAEWRDAALKKGAPVIGTRMSDASEKQATKFEPYRAVLEGITLEPRTADPETNVDLRVKPIVRAMAAKKKEIG